MVKNQVSGLLFLVAFCVLIRQEMVSKYCCDSAVGEFVCKYVLVHEVDG